MKVSLITISYNSARLLERSLQSVEVQTYPDIEHIVIDGGSTDGTLDIIARHRSRLACVVSEPDNGIYDAINKGLRFATGDIIGILNSDDMLADTTTIETIVRKMEDTGADVLYGDLIYCKDILHHDSVVRYWRSNPFRPGLLEYGWMPPHPTLYLRRRIYDETGEYDPTFSISADYDFMLRLFSRRCKTVYLPNVLVYMSVGGVSNRNMSTMMLKTREDYRALRKNAIGGIYTVLFKKLRKIYQFFHSC